MRLPWITASVVSILLVAAAVLDALSGHGSDAGLIAAWCVVTLVPTAFGLLVVTRRRGHPIGWLLLANGAVLTLVGFADAYARYAALGHPDALPGGAWAVVVVRPRLAAAVRRRDRDRLGVPRRPAAVPALAPAGRSARRCRTAA